ncbi:MAG TPA: chloride channel protein, partial [Candidatus Kapabacteria bacterium]|nr:chloride channel protein [Candidatus Kapabacteria bacterium]
MNFLSYKDYLDFLNKLRLTIAERLLKLDLSQDIFLLIIASVVGVAAGFGAVIFHDAIEVVRILLFDKFQGLFSVYPWVKYVVIILPAIGGLAVGILNKVYPETKGHGVPDVMKAVIAKGGYIKSSLVFTKTIASALSIGSGGGAGREGPIVQIGASVGSAVGQFFKLSSDQLRTLVACGAAGGIAAIFNAPLGGVMFALEIIIGSFSVRQFSPIVVSAVLATAISRSYLGDHPTIVQTNYHLVSNYELFFYLLLGVASGFISVGFIKILYKVEDIFHHELKKIPAVLMPALGGLGVGVMLIWIPSLAGFSYEINNQAILGQVSIVILIAVFFLKPIATGLTL